MRRNRTTQLPTQRQLSVDCPKTGSEKKSPKASPQSVSGHARLSSSNVVSQHILDNGRTRVLSLVACGKSSIMEDDWGVHPTSVSRALSRFSLSFRLPAPLRLATASMTVAGAAIAGVVARIPIIIVQTDIVIAWTLVVDRYLSWVNE